MASALGYLHDDALAHAREQVLRAFRRGAIPADEDAAGAAANKLSWWGGKDWQRRQKAQKKEIGLEGNQWAAALGSLGGDRGDIETAWVGALDRKRAGKKSALDEPEDATIPSRWIYNCVQPEALRRWRESIFSGGCWDHAEESAQAQELAHARFREAARETKKVRGTGRKARKFAAEVERLRPLFEIIQEHVDVARAEQANAGVDRTLEVVRQVRRLVTARKKTPPTQRWCAEQFWKLSAVKEFIPHRLFKRLEWRLVIDGVIDGVRELLNEVARAVELRYRLHAELGQSPAHKVRSDMVICAVVAFSGSNGISRELLNQAISSGRLKNLKPLTKRAWKSARSAMYSRLVAPLTDPLHRYDRFREEYELLCLEHLGTKTMREWALNIPESN